MAESIVQNLIEFIPKVRGAGFQQLNKGIMSSHKNLFSLRNMFGAFFGYDLYSAFRNLIPQVVETSQKLGAMKSRFQAVSTSARAGADELNWVGEQSKRLGLDFLRTADDYSIFFATVSKNMGQGTTRKVFEQWAEAFRVLHIDPERQTRVLYALREISSKGKIYMQDLALQLGSAVPDAMNLAAKSMGYTGPKAVERFRQAIKDGAIDVKKFIPLFSEAVNKQYVSSKALNYAMGQTDAQLQLINTHWQFMQKKILESGLQDDIVNFLKNTNKLLGFLEAHASGLYKWIKIIVGALAFILVGRGISGIMTLFGVVVKLIPKISSIARLLVMLRGAFATLVGSPFAKLLFKLLGLGGGAGWYIAIIAGLGFILSWVIKKFFPNVWSTIMSLWTRFKIMIWNLIDDINNHPAIIAMKKWFGTEKKGLAKDIETKQSDWAKKYPNRESVSNVGGFFDALNMWLYSKAMNLTPQTKALKFAQQAGPSITKYFLEQKYKIDVKVDGVEDKQTVLDSVKSAFDAFAENQKKENAFGIKNSRIFANTPFSPGY